MNNPSPELNRLESVGEFVKTNPDYYKGQFNKIGSQADYVFSFNFWAFLLGPIWYCSRSVWNWGLAFLILETVGWVQISRGASGDLAASARERIAQIEGTIAFREKQLQAALEAGSEKVAVYKRTIESLEGTIGGIRAEAVQAEEQGITIMLAGLLVLFGIKFVQAAMENTVL